MDFEMIDSKPVKWNPWHGCHKCSPGCHNCFVFEIDSAYGRDASRVTRSKTGFDVPLARNRHREFKYEAGTIFQLCFTSDFFIEEADGWRPACWDMIRHRNDCFFVCTTKRPERIKDCLPTDWGDGWENFVLAVSCETQVTADIRIPILLDVPIKHRQLFLSPLLEYVDVKPYLLPGNFDRICVGGESYSNARLCNSRWVEQIYIDCLRCNQPFYFHQTGSNFLFGNAIYAGSLQQQRDRAEIVTTRYVDRYNGRDVSEIPDLYIRNK